MPGRSYGNRTDLNLNRMPVAEAPVASHGPASATAAPAPQAAPPRPGPGALGDFTRETEFPDEPLTAGVPVGPGPGPEALGLPSAEDADLGALAPYLPGLELAASQATSTQALRQFVRRVRGAIPPGT